MILETDRLILRPLTREDASTLHALMGDPEVMAFWDVPATDDMGLTNAILEGQLQDIERGAAFYWAIRTHTDDAFVGFCDLSDVDLWHRRGEIGFMLARSYWGGGYAFEAVSMVIEHAIGSMSLRKLSARVHLGNDRSVRLLERLGFQSEGLLRSHIVRGDERRDCLIFGRLL
jgi:RimJ/RimL family protein N-acetyltransferase